jgi:methylenetetrahydrofolate dehydrogenase (NADP+)/methenyltetrahydrofolate cyclohydrolase
MLINGNVLANQIKSNLKRKIRKFKTPPGLGIILVGSDKPSRIFVEKKIQFCQEVGIRIDNRFISTSKQNGIVPLKKKLIQTIKELNQSKKIHGIILQLPLPVKLRKYQEECFRLIEPGKDIDCFNPRNLGRLNSGRAVILPAVAMACLELLEKFKISPRGKNVLVVGWGQIVGKPLIPLLLQRGATVTVCHKFTRDLTYFSREADIIISAVGKPGIIKGPMVKKGIIAIDIGSSFYKNKIRGDFDLASLKNKAKLITPVPGGIGPITVAMVAKNVVTLYSRFRT